MNEQAKNSGSSGRPFLSCELDTYASVYERDTDLALVMALQASMKVRRLFADAAGWTECSLLDVKHSVPTSDGREADIELRLGTSERLYVIQIENKLDCAFQPDQPESYAQRARELKERHGVEAKAILFCPERYARAAKESSTPFHERVSYESVRDTLLSEGPWARQAALLLEHGILKHRRSGSQSPEDPQVTRFFARFADLAASEGLPEVPPVGRKAGAGFLWYPREGTLTQPGGWTRASGSEGAWLVAKLVKGCADIELTGVLPHVLPARLRAALEDQPVEVVVGDKSVQLRKRTAAVDPAHSLIDQFDQVADFVRCLVDLRAWWERTGRAVVEAGFTS